MSGQTLILTSPMIMTDPGNAPFFPDLDLGVMMRFDAARHLGSYADSAPVTSFIGDGKAPLSDRTYSRKTSGWDWPVMDADGWNGTPALFFAGNAQIGNVGQGSQSVPDPVSQPMTRCFLVRLEANIASSTAKGFIRAASSTYLQTIRTGPTGGLIVDFGASKVPGITMPLQQWAPLIVVANGEASSVKLGRAAPVKIGTAGVAAYAGEIFGGNVSTTPPASDPYPFRLARYDRYSRALSDQEQDLWVEDALAA